MLDRNKQVILPIFILKMKLEYLFILKLNILKLKKYSVISK